MMVRLEVETSVRSAAGVGTSAEQVSAHAKR